MQCEEGEKSAHTMQMKTSESEQAVNESNKKNGLQRKGEASLHGSGVRCGKRSLVTATYQCAGKGSKQRSENLAVHKRKCP